MLHLRTFGAPELLRADGTHVTLQRRPFALIAVVAAMGARGMSRQKALGLLWPDVDEDRARHALAQTLYALRRSCGADVIDGTAKLRLDPALVTSDVIDFERAIAAGESETASASYTGPFLDGFHLPNANDFERWVEGERSRLQRAAAKAIESCAARAGAAGRGSEAVELWRRASALDPLDGRVALALAEALAGTGDSSGALKHVRLHQELRRAELDLPPDAALLAFSERLRETPPQRRHVPRSEAAPEKEVQVDAAGSAMPRREPLVPGSPLTPEHGADIGTDAGSYAGSYAGRPPRHLLRWGMGALAALTVIAATTAFYLNGRSQPLNQHRVVVAVFENQTSDTSLAPLGDMMADWIATELARTRLVDVIDSRAVLSAGANLEGKSGPVTASSMREMARGVGGGIVVWGTYYRRGDTLEFHAQLTDVRDGALLREIPTVLASVRDPMAGIRKVSERVTGALATVEDPRLAEWAKRGGVPPSYDAYREFVDGLQADVRMDPVAALAHYRRARGLDSTFLEPLLFAADAEHSMGDAAVAEAALDTVSRERDRLTTANRDMLDYELATLYGKPDRGYEIARDMAIRSPSSESYVIAAEGAMFISRPREALQWLERVDPNKGWVRGWAEYWIRAVECAHVAGNDAEALKLAHQARLAFPTQTVGYVALAVPLAGMGRIQELNAELDSAASAPGDDWWRYDETLDLAASELFAHGDSADARVLWQRAAAWYARRPPDANWSGAMRDLQIRVLVHLDRWQDAERLGRTLVREHPAEPTFRADLGMALAAGGDTAGARSQATHLDQLLAAVPASNAFSRGKIALARARVAAAVDDSAAAVSYMEQARTGEYLWLYQVRHDAVFHHIWGYKPYQNIMRVRG